MMTVLAVLIAVVMLAGVSYIVVAAIRGCLLSQIQIWSGNLDGMLKVIGECLTVIADTFNNN